MANPFYIEPASGLTGFKSLTEGLGSRVEYERGKAEEGKKQKIRQEAAEAEKSGDIDKINELTTLHPWITEELESGLKFKNERTKQSMLENLRKIVLGKVTPSQGAINNIEVVEEEGGVGNHSIEFAKAAQEEQETTGGQEEMKKRARVLYGMLDPAGSKELRALEGKEEEPTGDIKNFQHYQTLLKENPEQAAEFAQQTGITTSSDDRTTAIKEFEYGVKNPDFVLAQKKKTDSVATKSVKDTTFKDSSGLRKEFLAQSKEYQKVRDSYTRVIGSTQEPSPAGDLSLIFNYMKMLDPASVVRESEFATAASTGSYGQRMQASVQKVLSGERLAPEMRADFVKKAGVLFNGMQKQHKKREDNYKGIANKNNLPVDEVVVDITAPAEEEPQYKEGQTAIGPNVSPYTGRSAPQGAIDLLKANPELLDAFVAKYGYTPEDI